MFERDVLIKGEHATRAKALCMDKGAKREGSANLFPRYLDLYLMAPVIGILKGRQAGVDSTSKDTASIFMTQITPVKRDLEYIYRTIVLCHNEVGITDEIKINRAFKDYKDEETKKANIELFESYVRGGIDVLYEEIVEDRDTTESYFYKVIDFIADFREELKIEV